MGAGAVVLARIGDTDAIPGLDGLDFDVRSFTAPDGKTIHDALCALRGKGGVVVDRATRLSPAFPGYVREALAVLERDPGLAFASLGAYRLRPCDRLPFTTLQDGSDGIYLAAPPLVGAVLGATQIEAALLSWDRAQGGGIEGLAEAAKPGLFPRAPVAAGFPAEAFASQNIDRAERRWTFEDRPGSLARYDRWFELEPEVFLRLCPALADIVRDQPLQIDLYGVKPLADDNSWVLTTRGCRNPSLSFGLELQPIEANVMGGVAGEVIRLARRKDLDPASRPFRPYLARHVGRAVDIVAYLRSVVSGAG